MFQERESQINRALENLNFSKSSGSSSDNMEYERYENLSGTQPSKNLHDNLQPNWQVMKNDQPKRSLRDYLYPTHANTSSSMNVWGGCGYNTQSSWTCPTRSDYYIEVLREIEDEANAYQWLYSSNIGNMHSPQWDDYYDYSWENGHMDDFSNLPQEPTPDGSYVQDSTYVPPSIEWSYETPSECSYVPPPPPPEVQSLEDMITKFIQNQNEFIHDQNEFNQTITQELRDLTASICHMIQEDVTLSSENDIQIDDPKNLDHFLLLDHTNAQISKGADESSAGGMIINQFDSEPYKPAIPFPQWLRRSHQEILEKDSHESLLDSDSFPTMESSIVDFQEFDVPVLKEIKHTHFDPLDGFETFVNVFQIPNSDNLKSLDSCITHSLAFNDQSLWAIENAFIVGPKEDTLAKFEENGLLQTLESEFSKSCVDPSKHSNVDIATACSAPVLEEFEKFDFEELHALESLEPRSSSMQSLPSDVHGSFLKEETLMVVTFSPLDKKCVVRIESSHLVFVQCVEENFVWDPGGFLVEYPVV